MTNMRQMYKRRNFFCERRDFPDERFFRCRQQGDQRRIEHCRDLGEVNPVEL